MSNPEEYAKNQYRLADCYRAILQAAEQMGFTHICIPILGAEQVGVTHAVQVAVESVAPEVSNVFRAVLCSRQAYVTRLASGLIQHYQKATQETHTTNSIPVDSYAYQIHLFEPWKPPADYKDKTLSDLLPDAICELERSVKSEQYEKYSKTGRACFLCC